MKLNSKLGLSLVLAALCVSNAGWAKKKSAKSVDVDKLEERVEKAAIAVENAANVPDKWITPYIAQKATCAMIIPGNNRGGFLFFGGEGGKGVAVCLHHINDGLANSTVTSDVLSSRPTGTVMPSYPIFVETKGFGLQANLFFGGFTRGNRIVIFMDPNARNKLGDRMEIQAQASASATVGLGRGVGVGINHKGAYYANYDADKGFLVQAGINGIVVQPTREANAHYYSDTFALGTEKGTNSSGQEVNQTIFLGDGRGSLESQLLRHVPKPDSSDKRDAFGQPVPEVFNPLMNAVADTITDLVSSAVQDALERKEEQKKARQTGDDDQDSNDKKTRRNRVDN